MTAVKSKVEEKITLLRDMYRHRTDRLREWKKVSGGLCLGYLCTYFPVEIVAAVGILPVRITGGTEEITLADTVLQTFFCPFSRSALDMALKGKYDFLDGIVHAYTCDATCGLFNTWERNIPCRFTYLLSPPYFRSPEAERYYRAELTSLGRALEDFSGRHLDDTSLCDALEQYEENRALLRQLCEFRRGDPPPIAGSEVLDIVNAAATVPVDEYNGHLRDLLQILPERERQPNGKSRLLVSGSVIDDSEILEAIEQAGGAVVADDLCTGTRNFLDNTPPGDDPLDRLIDRHFARTPCASRLPAESRAQRIMRLAREYNTHGVIFLIQKFCDPHLADYPFLKACLEDEGVPSLLIETEHRMSSRGQLTTRVESFLEMVAETEQ